MENKSRFNKFSNLTDNKVQELKDVLQGKKEAEEHGSKGEHPEELLPEADRGNLEAEIVTLEEKLKKAEEDAKTFKEGQLRALANLDNFRKRMEREKDEIIKYGNEKILKEFLPVLDHLEMALEHTTKASQAKTTGAIEEGVRSVIKQFFSVLEKFGAEAVGFEKEKFDPHRHEAVAMVEAPEHDPDTIVQVHRKGFVLNGRLIRPAMVSISKLPESDDFKEENTVH